MGMAPVAVLEDVSRRYGETVALEGVSLSVREGEIFGLIGPNGAGKTTLVRALLGTTAVDGQVRLFGRDPTAVDRDRIGLLPQAFDPPARLTPRELLTYYGGLYDRSTPPGEGLAAVGVTDVADRPYEDLSGGQQRRVCVATALVNEPALLVLDEPTTGVDPAGRRRLWDRLDALAAAGTTILLTTHYMAEAHHLADRVGLLADGRLVALDSPGALVAAHGGESRLHITGAVEDVDVGALSYDASIVDGALVVRNVPPTEIGTVVDAVEAAGGDYDTITWAEPDLEDVYLALTDRGGTDRSREGPRWGAPG